MSPVKLTGILTPKPPPAALPAAVGNQFVPAAVSGAVSCAPLSIVKLGAAVKVRFALAASRGVEVAANVTTKPDAVMLEILTEPGTITGARRGTTIAIAGGLDGNGRVCPDLASLTAVSTTLMVPATLPICTAGSETVVAPCGMSTWAVVPPVANWISGFV